MGSWNTVHLFDVSKFYNDIIPTLRGEKGSLKNDYIDFLKLSRIGGINDLSDYDLKKLTNESISKIIRISNQFDSIFKIHKIYNNIKPWEEQRKYLNDNEYYYTFNMFFEYSIFKYCADFHPHIYTGKRGLNSVLAPKKNTIANEILDNLENFNTFFCADNTGVGNWINIEDTNILFNCKEDLFSKPPYDEDDYNYFKKIIKLIEIASSNNLGLIRGIDLRESMLEKLPGNKLIEESYWKNFKGDFNEYLTSITKENNIEKEHKINVSISQEKKKINHVFPKDSLSTKPIKKNKNIPNDLKIISFKDFHSTVYESVLENKIFISYYYESGFSQENLVLELNSKEVLKFRENANEFINKQATLISKNFNHIYKERNIENFIDKNLMLKLMTAWKNK
ncbi:hypothetical protein ACQY1Q_10010 [Tenacibaculum sp. TC6]|uniref:hypothetical protein n=1 Tax=Tenacibaculum sp. TC6 TaxID=3423223 RepID=UPI003D35A341